MKTDIKSPEAIEKVLKKIHDLCFDENLEADDIYELEPEIKKALAQFSDAPKGAEPMTDEDLRNQSFDIVSMGYMPNLVETEIRDMIHELHELWRSSLSSSKAEVLTDEQIENEAEDFELKEGYSDFEIGAMWARDYINNKTK